MRKQSLIIFIVILISLLFTWGILRASAGQNLSSARPVSTLSTVEQVQQPSQDCPWLDRHSPAIAQVCLDWDESEADRHNLKGRQSAGISQNETPGDNKAVIWTKADGLEPKGTNLNHPGTYSLSVNVMNASGNPSADTDVYVYTNFGTYLGYATTDLDGFAFFDLASGTYKVKVFSSPDNLFLYQEGVVVPGTVTFSAVGTPEVTLTAKNRNSFPLASATVFVGVAYGDYWQIGLVGTTDNNGLLVFHVTPGFYDVDLVDWDEHYVLNTLNQDFRNTAGSVNFNMSTQPSAEIIVDHPEIEVCDLNIGPKEGNVPSFGWTDLPKGIHFTINANSIYWASQEFYLDDPAGYDWGYLIYSGRILDFGPGEVYDFIFSGPVIVNGRTQSAELGTWITLTTEPLDSFDNFFTSIYTFLEGTESREYIYPQIQLTDPNGSIISLDYHGGYKFPATSIPGTYQMHFEWDSGPYRGLITANSQFEVLPLADLAVYVETADGLPAANAWVAAITSDNHRAGYGYTGSDGYVMLDIPPGNYRIIAISPYDHFSIYQDGVTSPGIIPLSAVDTPEINLIAKKRDGSPLDHGEVFIGPTGGSLWARGSLGSVEPDGTMVFHATPDFYDVGIRDVSNFYALYARDQDFSTSNPIISFDMLSNPSARLVISHPYDSTSYLFIYPREGNLQSFFFDNVLENTSIIVSTEIGYGLLERIERDDQAGNHWIYEFELDPLEMSYFDPDEVFPFTIGGELSDVVGRTEDATVGTYVTLAEFPMDSFGSFLTFIYTYSVDYQDASFVYPDILLTDPNSATTQTNWWFYYIPETAPIGLYSMNLEWDTGEPYQGIITGTSQFRVLPQQTSAIISPGGGTLYSAWDDVMYEFAAGTFTDTVIVTQTVKYTDTPPYSPLVGIDHFFDVTAIFSDTGLLAEPTLPYTITIGYGGWELGVAIENSLGLYFWQGGQWHMEPTSQVDPALNRITATPDHFSTWGVLGDTNRIYLSFIGR